MTQTIRERNRILVLEKINHLGPISRADLARATGLNKASISEIVAELLAESYIEETDAAKSSGGRRPIPLKLTAREFVALACDIAPHEIRLAMGYNDGSLALRRTIQLQPRRETILDILIESISSLIRDFQERNPKNTPKLCAMTMSIYGVVSKNQIVFTPYYDLSHLQLADALYEHFGIPVYLLNEADLAANGEWATRGPVDNLLSLKIREGIGLGIIQQGRREHGANGFAGEFGHSILVPNGIPCPCGNRGCLEQYLSETALLTAFAESKTGREPKLSELFKAWDEGDPETQRLIDAYIHYLAVSINNLIRLFDPRNIVLNSRVAPHIDGFVEQIKEQIRCQIPSKYDICLSTLGDDATILGGLALAFERFYGLSHFFFSVNSPSK